MQSADERVFKSQAEITKYCKTSLLGGLEKMAEVLPGNLNAVQFYSDGTSAVEAGIRAARAISNHHEFISCFRDFHGKSMAAISCAQMVRGDVHSY